MSPGNAYLESFRHVIEAGGLFMNTKLLLLGCGLVLSGVACGKSSTKKLNSVSKSTKAAAPEPEILKPLQPPPTRSVSASSDGALAWLGVERGQTQQHIKTDGSPTELEFTVPPAIPIGDIVSIHLKLPE
jgi:hypothetical protein